MKHKEEMWVNLPIDQRKKYKKLITNFASLTEAFTQKSFGDKNVVPFVNSKFQETAFQYAFHATEEDIANTSFDASILTDNGDKYLVGIKSFSLSSGDQKIAQFKSVSTHWAKQFAEIDKNAKLAKNKNGKPSVKKINTLNHDIYLDLAKKISELRNERIRSSRAQLRGFKDDGNVISVYHVLMPSETQEHKPLIHVGETSYSEVDIDNIKIKGCTGPKNPTNFKFTDGIHTYKYASADSQLFMSFKNKDIIVDTWNVHYISDAMKFFENLDDINTDDIKVQYSTNAGQVVIGDFQSFSWMLTDKDGQVNTRSGINAFNAKPKRGPVKSKNKIEKFIKKYTNKLSESEINDLKEKLYYVLCPTKEESKAKNYINNSNKTKEKLNEFGHENLYLMDDLLKLMYDRPHNEVYIPIPNSKKFHHEHPNFFGEGIGDNLLDKDGSIVKPQEDRTFMLRFLPSENKIKGYIDQENGKAIQSPHSQSTLGKWLREKVFQLKDLELLTGEKLENLGINAIRMVKNTKENTIDVYFIWIDPENPPADAIGWVGKKK